VGNRHFLPVSAGKLVLTRKAKPQLSLPEKVSEVSFFPHKLTNHQLTS
jgi:hypothetical protein